MKKKSDYNYFIDLLKFVFSIIIVLYHTWPFAGGYGLGVFNYGYLAVDFYFIVTGYLMMQSIEKDNNKKENLGVKTLKFIYKKIAGIFPYILFAFILGALLIYRTNIFSVRIVTANAFVSEILQLGVLGQGFPINSSTWYISAMLLALFCLYPLANKFKENYSTLIAPLLLLLGLGICYSFNINTDDPITKIGFALNGLYKAFIFILLGNISYAVTKYLKNIKFTKIGEVLLSIIEITLVLLLIRTMHFNMFGSIVVAIMTILLIIITFSGKSYSKNLCNSPIFKKLGTIGFLMYLNNIYFRTALLVGNFQFSYKKYVVIYVGLTFAVSLLAYYLIPVLVKLFKKFLILMKKIIICN